MSFDSGGVTKSLEALVAFPGDIVQQTVNRMGGWVGKENVGQIQGWKSDRARRAGADQTPMKEL